MTEQSSFANGAYGSQHETSERRSFYPMAATRTEIQATATNAEQYVRDLVRERPVVAVLTAMGFGYFVARLFARGMR